MRKKKQLSLWCSPNRARDYHLKVADSVLDLIGNTPMVKLRSIPEEGDADIFVKLEYLNPSGSMKDRIALEMIRQAEAEGKLKQGYTIIEASTGNTGTALSLVGTCMGYRVIIYMPEGMTPERIKLMESYGAEVHQLKLKGPEASDESVAGAEVEIPTRQRCLEIEGSTSGFWWARQFSNPANTAAHVKTGQEVLRQMDGKVDAFVMSVGTGGTLLGVARALRAKLPTVGIIAAEPASAAYPLIEGYRKVPGASDEVSGGIIAELLDSGIVDEVVQVTNDEAVVMSERLVKEEGLFAGVSAGANVHVAKMLAQRLGKGKRIVTILPDSGDRYLTEKKYTT
jgi:cysteine synthase A